MKKIISLIIILAFCMPSFGAMTYTMDLRPTAYDWTGNPAKDNAWDWAKEVETQVEAWTLDGNTTVTFPTNAATIDNITNGQVTITEAAESLQLRFTTNNVELCTGSGILGVDFNDLYIVMNEISAPTGNPAANLGWLYVKDNGGTTTLYFEDSAGVATSCIASAGTPAGSDTQLQYNDGGSFGALASVIYDDTNVEVADDFKLAFGTDADWTINYDESVDNQLLWETNNTSAAATTDPMLEFLIDADTANGTGITADQQVFGVAKGTQASNTALFTLDEDGDAVFAGSLTAGSWTVTTLSTTGTTTLGDGTGTVEVASSSWDVSTAGAISGVTTLGLSGDLTSSAGDVILANGKALKGSTTTAQTLLVQAYDVDNTTYRNVITLTNGNTIALALGTGNETVAIDSSDWDVSTTGAVTGIGAVSMDGALSISNASPTINILDSDATAGDNNITIVGAATDTGDGTEDVDLTISQQIAGTARAVATFNADGDITLGYGTQNVVATADVTVTGSDLTLGTAGVKLTGDGDGAITFLGLGDGTDEDLMLNLDDTANTAVWTSPTSSLDKWVFTGMTLDADQVEISAASPLLEFFDTDATAGDVNAKITIAATDTGDGTEDIDVTFTQQVAGSDVDFLTANADGALTLDGGTGITMTDIVTFSGGQTRKVLFPPKVVELDGTAPPTLADYGTDGQSNISALQFDADGAGTDMVAYISWLVPDGYVENSARLNVGYTFSDAEDTADEAQFDFTVDACAAGEALDTAGTALVDQTTVITDAATDNGNLHITQYDIEQEDIAVDDLVTIEIAVDVSESLLAASGTLDVLYFEIEYESTE